jgi:NAD(P)-dependent dehydrogenase (short-subunit alcohol dehydrogenase family)
MSRVVVTGGSMGIGLTVAKHLAKNGHELTLVARGAEALERAVESLTGSGHEWFAFDAADEAAWRQVPAGKVAGLVCAAAVMEPIGAVGDYTIASFRQTMNINVVGTLAAIEHCLPGLREGPGAVVTFGGGGATAPLPRFDAYAASKAAVARLTENLAPVLAPVIINCVAPGFVATRLHNQTLAAGPEAAGADFHARTEREVAGGGFPALAAAELVELLLSGVEFSGKLISAQWDDWRSEEYKARLVAEPDLATIRRIDDVFFRQASGRRET